MPSRWHIVTPFKVKNVRAFMEAAKASDFWHLFERNQAGYVYCIDPRRSEYERPELDKAYELLQAHLVPKEYALFRIEQWKEEDLGRDGIARFDEHVRYEKVYRDRTEPTIYSEDRDR